MVIMLVMLVVDVVSLPVRALSSNVLSWAPFCAAAHAPVSVHADRSEDGDAAATRAAGGASTGQGRMSDLGSRPDIHTLLKKT